MDMFIVQGGTPLSGTIPVSGSKNASLPVMAAALMGQGRTRLEGVPDLVDVRTLAQLLQALGVDVNRRGEGELDIEVVDERPDVAEYDLVRRMRASVCVLGPLLARRGRACVSLPGGCNIGTRPIDLHLKGLAALGADINVRNGYVQARAKRLRGARIHLLGPNGSTVTGTCNVLAAATLARGTTVIDAAATEPEVVALADFLNAMGARISGQGTPQLVIDGVGELSAAEFRVIPDRIEAATLLIAAAMTRGRIRLSQTNSIHLSAVIDLLREMGAEISIERDHNGNETIGLAVAGTLKPMDVTALPYPGIPTDIQAQLMALLCTIPGASVVRDLVFPDRFMHVAELCRMGAKIRQQGAGAIISGVPKLMGTHVMASDLRASAALVLAGLAAEGATAVRRIYHLDRGYESLERKLTSLGAHVERIREDEAGLNNTRAIVPVPAGPDDWKKSA
jgi:UDP-N-acetylglucosamine 1-carboxyvinyltransferase